jgi:hypothetical protein
VHYSENSGSVRVDRFKESGKWYDTFALDMSEYYDHGIIPHDAVRTALDKEMAKNFNRDNFVEGWLNQGGFFVILEPYHKNAYPVVLKK